MSTKPTDRFSESIKISNPRPAGGPVNPGPVGPATPVQGNPPSIFHAGREVIFKPRKKILP